MSCLTASQVQTAKMIYAPAKDPKTGAILTGGLMPGTELQWATLYGPDPYGNAADPIKYIAMKDANWDPNTFNPATDIEKARKADPDNALRSAIPTSRRSSIRAESFMYQLRRSASHLRQRDRYHQVVLDKVGKSVEASRSSSSWCRDVPLSGRTRHRHARQDGAITQWVEQGGAGTHRRVASDQRQGRSHASALRSRRLRSGTAAAHRRRGEFFVRGRLGGARGGQRARPWAARGRRACLDESCSTDRDGAAAGSARPRHARVSRRRPARHADYVGRHGRSGCVHAAGRAGSRGAGRGGAATASPFAGCRASAA